MPRGPTIPEDVRQRTLRRLRRHVEKNHIGRHGVVEILAEFKGRYLYIDYIEENRLYMWNLGNLWEKSLGRKPPMSRKRLASKLCRLKYTGDPNRWEFQIYKYSDNGYDVAQDFPFGGGTVEECFDAAASLYITEPGEK